LKTENDLVFDLSDPTGWNAVKAKAITGKPGRWKIKDGAVMTYLKPLRACLADFTHIYLKLSAPINQDYVDNRAQARLITIGLNIERPQDSQSLLLFNVPLYPDNGLHEYFIPTRLLGSDSQGVLTGLQLQPYLRIPGGISEIIQIQEIRLISKDGSKQCK
jgi:hypothetical protein